MLDVAILGREDAGEIGYAPAELPQPQKPGCQWIAGEPSFDDACKCGAEPVEGSPYCAPHRARAYVPLSALNQERRRPEIAQEPAAAKFELPPPAVLEKARRASLPKATRSAQVKASPTSRGRRADAPGSERHFFTHAEDSEILRMRARGLSYRAISARLAEMGRKIAEANIRGRWQRLMRGAG